MAMSDNMESMEEFAMPGARQHNMLGTLPQNQRNSSSMSLTNSQSGGAGVNPATLHQTFGRRDMPSFGGSLLGAGGVGGPFNNANKMELMNMIDQ